MQSFILFKNQPQQRARGNAELQPKRETSASYHCSGFCPSRHNHTDNFLAIFHG